MANVWRRCPSSRLGTANLYNKAVGESAAAIASDFWETGGVDALDAVSLLGGIPAVGAGVLGQKHGLAGVGIAIGAPTLTNGDLGQDHVLGADLVIAGVPIFDISFLTQLHALGATDLESGPMLLDASALGQIHALSTGGAVMNSPALGVPIIGEPGKPIALVAIGAEAGNPVLGNPDAGGGLLFMVVGSSTLRRSR